MKKLGYFLFAIGIIIGSYGLTMNTTVETGGETIGSGEYSVTIPKMKVNNLGLMDDRRTILYGAGLSMLLGAIFIGFGTLATNVPQGQKTASSQPPSQLQQFIAGSSISPQEVDSLAALAKQQPSIVVATSRATGNSLLHLAASYGLLGAVELLLEAGAEKGNSNGNGQRAYQLAKDEAMADLLRV